MTPRIVLVTGGTRGIGRAVAERLARAGDSVLAVGRDEQALGEVAAIAGIRAERCDVTDERAVAELFERVGTIDVLVCNAGAAETGPLERTALGTWERLHAANATSVFLAMRAALPGMSRTSPRWPSSLPLRSPKMQWTPPSSSTAPGPSSRAISSSTSTERFGRRGSTRALPRFSERSSPAIS